jgi:hypothetical protein
MPKYQPPRTLVKSFEITVEDENGKELELFSTDNNYQRLFRLPCELKAKSVRLKILETRQADESRIFAFEVS